MSTNSSTATGTEKEERGLDDTVSTREYILELEIKMQILIDYMNDHDLLMDGCFTFDDGEVWASTP